MNSLAWSIHTENFSNRQIGAILIDAGVPFAKIVESDAVGGQDLATSFTVGLFKTEISL